MDKLLFTIMACNSIGALLVMHYFMNNMKTLKKNLTEAQIILKRKTNGIGTLEIMVLLCFATSVMQGTGALREALEGMDTSTEVLSVLRYAYTLVTTVVLIKIWRLKKRYG